MCVTESFAETGLRRGVQGGRPPRRVGGMQLVRNKDGSGRERESFAQFIALPETLHKFYI